MADHLEAQDVRLTLDPARLDPSVDLFATLHAVLCPEPDTEAGRDRCPFIAASSHTTSLDVAHRANQELVVELMALGHEFGPLAVALAAADLTSTDLLVHQLTDRPLPGQHPARRCPTPCDDGCTDPCHEAHLTAWSRAHEPSSCPAVA